MKRTVASRAIGRGLAKVEPSSPNTLIAYAAKAGSTASDGDSKNSPFTSALVEHSPTPGLDLRKAFGFVRDDVLKNTSNRQEPYVYGSLGGDDVALVPAKAAAPASSAQADTRKDYELALQIGNGDALNAFLAHIRVASTPISPRFSWTRSPRRKPAWLPPRRRGWPSRRTRGLRPRARNRRSRPRRPPTPKPPRQPARRRESQAGAQQKPLRPSRSAPRLRTRRKKSAWMMVSRTMRPASKPTAGRSQDTKPDTKVAALPDPSAPAPPSPAELAKSVQTSCAASAASPDRRTANGTRHRGVRSNCSTERRHKAGCEARKPRCAGCDQGQNRTCVSADLRNRFQGRRRTLRQDHLRRRLFPQRRQ